MKTYIHSKVFDIFKTTKEKISTNLTSFQYLSTLDFFLWNGVEPVAIECPKLYLNYVAKVVAKQSLKASAKLTSDDITKLPIHLFNMVTSSPEAAFKISKLMYINRGLMFGFLSFFRNSLAYYEELHKGADNLNEALRRTLIYRIEQSIGVRSQGNLHAALLQAAYWDNKARWFKALIVEKYTRMAILQAKSTYKDYNHYVELDDVIQIYMLVVNRAIDRCDARQGVLTTFIQNWFKSAKGEIAKLSRNQMDQSYDCLIADAGDLIHETLGVAMPDVSLELKQHVSYVSKQVDRIGLVRTWLNIPNFVSLNHKKILLRNAI